MASSRKYIVSRALFFGSRIVQYIQYNFREDETGIGNKKDNITLYNSKFEMEYIARKMNMVFSGSSCFKLCTYKTYFTPAGNPKVRRRVAIGFKQTPCIR